MRKPSSSKTELPPKPALKEYEDVSSTESDEFDEDGEQQGGAPRKSRLQFQLDFTDQECEKWGFSRDEMEEFQRLFIEFDEDGTGSIDINELRSMLRNLGKSTTTKSLYELIKLVDTDSSMEIEFNEFLLLMQLFEKQ